MKKRILLALLVIFGLFLVGCATTKTTEVFRFEVRELKLTLSSTSENKEKALKLIHGEDEKNATIAYTVSYVDGDKAGQIDMDNGIISVVGTGTNEKGYATTSINDNVKIIPISEGVVRFSAYVEGKENVADSIIVTVVKESMSGFKLSAIFSEIYVGTTTKFKTSAIPSYLDASVLKYEVSDERIATISEDGSLKGLVPGTVTVKAYSKYDPDMYAVTNVTVTYAQAGSISLYDLNDDEIEDEIVLTNGEELGVTTLVKPKEATLKFDNVSQKVSFKSSDSKVFTTKTDEEGNVFVVSVGGGEAVLTIESDDKKAKLEIDVKVNWPQTETFAVKSDELEVAVKKSVLVERDGINPEKACPDIKVEYKSDEDKEFISINGNKIEGLKPGVAYVNVSTIESGNNEPLSVEVKVTVSYDTIEEITLPIKAVSIMNGDSKFVEGVYTTQIKYNLKPAGSNPSVKFESNNEEVATVDAEGNVTIKDHIGTAIITITSNDNPEVKAEYEVTVNAKPESFTVEAPDDMSSFVYSEDLVIKLIVTVLPAEAPQYDFDVDFDSNDSNCYIEFDIDKNEITLILDPESLGTFDVIITVDGVAGEWFRTYTVTLPE